MDAQVPETELSLVRAGQSAIVTSSRRVRTTGSVRIVTPEVNAQTRLGLARISLAPGAQLRPSMFARAEIAVGDQPTLVVPSSAVVYRGQGRRLCRGSGRCRPLRPGHDRGSQRRPRRSRAMTVSASWFRAQASGREGDHVTVAPATAAAPAGDARRPCPRRCSRAWDRTDGLSEHLVLVDQEPDPHRLLFVVLTIAGTMSYFKLRTNNFPDVGSAGRRRHGGPGQRRPDREWRRRSPA